MAYKVLDLYRDLPRVNCGECGRRSCFAFAGAVFLEGARPSSCTRLTPEAAAEIETRLREAHARSARDGETPPAQAIAALERELLPRDLDALAADSGATLVSGAEKCLRLDYLGRACRFSAHGLTTEDGLVGARAAFVVLTYLARSRNAASSGRWITPLDLPNVGGLITHINACIPRVSRAFAGRLRELDEAALALGAREEDGGSASRCYVLPALPRVDIMLKFWDKEEDPEGRSVVNHPDFGRFVSAWDFDARVEILLAGDVLDRLGPQALVLLVEDLADELMSGCDRRGLPDG